MERDVSRTGRTDRSRGSVTIARRRAICHFCSVGEDRDHARTCTARRLRPGRAVRVFREWSRRKRLDDGHLNRRRRRRVGLVPRRVCTQRVLRSPSPKSSPICNREMDELSGRIRWQSAGDRVFETDSQSTPPQSARSVTYRRSNRSCTGFRPRSTGGGILKRTWTGF